MKKNIILALAWFCLAFAVIAFLQMNYVDLIGWDIKIL